MKNNTIIVIAIIFIAIISASSLGAYTLSNGSSQPTTNPTASPTIQPSPPASVSPTSTTTPNQSPQASPIGTDSNIIQSNPIPTYQPTQTPGSVKVIDANGAEVTVKVPVSRIICLTTVETVFGLGSGDKIVGIAGMLTNDVKDILPDYILKLPVVGDRDSSPNVELIIELKPDLILASQRLSDEHRKMFEEAGIAVIEDSLTGDRRNQYLRNLGLILNAQLKVEEIITYEEYYWNLVQERVANLQRSEKPVVFFEWYKAWFSTGPGGSYTGLIETAGGINLGENSTISSPQLSAEFVLEQNPDIIIRMLDYTSGETFTDFQNLYKSIISRTGIKDMDATKNNQVYVIKSTLLVERDVIGLLYFAKWFHPDLFTDIDPAAIHAEMIQRSFGAQLTGVFSYP